MSAVAAAEAAVVRAKLLAGAKITILVGAEMSPNGTINLSQASMLVLTAKSDSRTRQAIIAEFDRIIAENSEPQPQPSTGDA